MADGPPDDAALPKTPPQKEPTPLCDTTPFLPHKYSAHSSSGVHGVPEDTQMHDTTARDTRLMAIASELDCYWTGPLPFGEFMHQFLPDVPIPQIPSDRSFKQAMDGLTEKLSPGNDAQNSGSKIKLKQAGEEADKKDSEDDINETLVSLFSQLVNNLSIRSAPLWVNTTGESSTLSSREVSLQCRSRSLNPTSRSISMACPAPLKMRAISAPWSSTSRGSRRMTSSVRIYRIPTIASPKRIKSPWWLVGKYVAKSACS